MKRNRISFERHKQIGTYLAVLHRQIGDLLVEVSRAEGTSASVTRNLEKVDWRLTQIRSQLENVMFRDYPKEGDIRIYYPGDTLRDDLVPFEEFLKRLDENDDR
jgi:regulation of enolase protein 1 (concanavalin A-like superfamily)